MNDIKFVEQTKDHIEEVGKHLCKLISHLQKRIILHDSSKLRSPEYEGFKSQTEKLAGLTYGSDEYKRTLREIKPTIDHHYSLNPHHPEHYVDGIKGMTLIDLTEMLCDWIAATKRHNDGDIIKSIELNQQRFGYSDDIKTILKNTVILLKETN